MGPEIIARRKAQKMLAIPGRVPHTLLKVGTMRWGK